MKMRRGSDPVSRNIPLRVAAIGFAVNFSAVQAPYPLCCLAFSTMPLARGPPPLASWNGGHRRASEAFSVGFSKLAPLRAHTDLPPLPTTDDPFLLLGLDAPTTDAKEIKRAYRKRAMKYHPDVALGSDSTAEERDKASKEFARINAAYDMLTGGGKGNVGAGNSRGSASTSGAKSTSGGYNYQPPHRRTSSSSSYGKSTSWEDYMPKYDEEDAKYDAGGDSFGSIFSDVLTGAAGYAAGVSGGGGVMGDFIEFLENNMGGVGSSDDDDSSFQYASFDEVADEMDETDILVTSLETKLSKVQNDLMQAQADLNLASRFSEKLDSEERVAELAAREKVSKDYLKRGKKRLIRLRERYKVLVMEGRGGKAYGGSASGGTSGRGASDKSWDNINKSSAPINRGPAASPSSSPTTSSTSSSPFTAPATSSTKSWRNEGFSGSYGGRSSGGRRSRRETSTSSSPTSTPTASPTSTSPSSAPASSSTKSWRDEGFSSSYRGRSSGSRQNRRDAGNVNAGEPSTAPTGEPSNQQRRSPNDSARGRTVPQQYEPFVPPHRRTQSSADRVAQDKKRLRELKVDDDFDKLKRELGL